MEKSSASSRLNHKIISYICVFFSALFAFLFCSALILRTTVYNENYYVNILQKTKYCEYLTQDLQDQLVHLGKVSMEECPEEIFKDAVPVARVLNASLDYYKSCLNNTFQQPDTTALNEDLTTSLNDYLAVNYPELADDAETKANLKLLIDNCVQTYKDGVKTDLMTIVGKITFKTSGYIDIFIVVCAVLMVVFAVIIIPFNHSIRKRFMYLVLCATTSFLTIAVVPAVLFGTGIMSKASISSKALYTLVTAILSGIANDYLIAALVVAGISALTITISVMYSKYRA